MSTPVWEHLEIKGFQSLYDVALDLGQFTVIVGPSSSGKSALVRAIKGITSNVRGTGVVSHSKPGLSISVRTPEATVTLEKGIGVNGYRITPIGGGDERVWSKTAGTVPDAVSMVLTTDPVKPGSTWFAGQFDGPYLVGDPGSQIAGVLGNLSGVGIIRTAAREGARRSLESSAQVRAAAATVASVKEQIPAYKSLPGRIEKTADAQRRWDGVAEGFSAVKALVQVVRDVTAARTRIGVIPAQVPEAVRQAVVGVEELERATSRVSGLVSSVRMSQALEEKHVVAAEESARQASELRAEYARVLVEAGVCPTCGASTHREGVDHSG